MVEFIAAIWASRWFWIGLLSFGLSISWLTKEEEPEDDAEEKGEEEE